MRCIYLIGTFDTKSDELLYLKSIIESNDLRVCLVDVGTRSSPVLVDFSNETVASHHQDGAQVVLGTNDRGIAVENMSIALCNFMQHRDDISGVIGIGGSGGTALVAPMMQRMPIGIPKLLVSTVASGSVEAYVGTSDISMMYSVVDFLGLNPILKKILRNAGNSIAGMVKGLSDEIEINSEKKSIGLTMFGVTTTCVEALCQSFSERFNCLVFHATGTGGQSMEKLADSGLLDGVIDITTTEVCDYFFDGVFPCLPTRFDVFAQTKLPYVGSVGALDMINFGPKSTVPLKYKSRNLYVHNAQVTLMRTNESENDKMGCWIAEKLNKMDGEVRFLLPLAGVSAIDAPGQPFYDPTADAALFKAIEDNLIITEKRKLIKVDCNINDVEFASAALGEFKEAFDSVGN